MGSLYVSLQTPGYFDDKLKYNFNSKKDSRFTYLLYKDKEELLPGNEYLLKDFAIKVTADSLVQETVTEACSLVCSHKRWWSKTLVAMQFTIEPAEVAYLDKSQVQILPNKPNPFFDFTPS